ncbi:synaptogyrin-1a [Scomber japonicus]|uniref:synaptogyrin-1a n=1 Tax=Scomber japonicus TaxID=13676 RepID=UPI002305816B|nr:synaptogyrin-1a [Scomber japonicus]
MDGFQAYGAGKSGGTFDPQTFIRQPQTLIRILCWVFSIVVLGCVANEGYLNRPDEVEEFCIFNRNNNACNYAVTIGTLCFLCSSSFLALDIYFPQISGVKDRKKAVIADIGVSAFWSLLWFVGFCFIANQWQVSKEEDNPLQEGATAARATIAFSFFSVLTWAVQCLLAVYRWKLGSDSVTFNQDYIDPAQPEVTQEVPPTEEWSVGA